ncbi:MULTISPECIES: nucleotidyl transferase AbiEii/AbiGii toxin family protein [Parvibaculum]|uniref:nucleotidyl transferase AbiEii/AbiGii toxin family protein n=1 Tax=Parvibaculum TaxID=256616 RepID=UPI00141F07ED|nr:MULTISPECIES: nucleotidyl transferase AbiEii/AbiGii toxin family protein [Parvibaculum]NIJ40603.1 hypothetical protein [Parvibaculum indicum]
METLPPGSRKWPTSKWKALLRDAIRILDASATPTPWLFGGGTALAVHYKHRVSYDVDIFVPSQDALRDLAPQRNAITKSVLGENKTNLPGNYLKLRFPYGEIAFITGGRRTDTPSQAWEFAGRVIDIETPWETATKKMFFRASSLKIRDIFDIAAVIDHHGDELRECLPEVEDRLPNVLDRVKSHQPAYERRVLGEINATKTGRKYMTAAAIDSVVGFLEDWAHRPTCDL